MPSKSKAQHNFMEGVAHGSIPASPSTRKAAQEFVQADTGRDLHALPAHITKALKSHQAQKAARVRHGKGYPK